EQAQHRSVDTEALGGLDAGHAERGASGDRTEVGEDANRPHQVGAGHAGAGAERGHGEVITVSWGRSEAEGSEGQGATGPGRGVGALADVRAVPSGRSRGWCPAARPRGRGPSRWPSRGDRKSTRLNSSHVSISYAVFCLKKTK